MPLDGETDETASRWVISGADLPADIKGEEQLDGHLEATMDGKPFSYALKPHSHDEHAHDGRCAHAEQGHEDHADHNDEAAKAKVAASSPWMDIHVRGLSQKIFQSCLQPPLRRNPIQQRERQPGRIGHGGP